MLLARFCDFRRRLQPLHRETRSRGFRFRLCLRLAWRLCLWLCLWLCLCLAWRLCLWLLYRWRLPPRRCRHRLNVLRRCLRLSLRLRRLWPRGYREPYFFLYRRLLRRNNRRRSVRLRRLSRRVSVVIVGIIEVVIVSLPVQRIHDRLPPVVIPHQITPRAVVILHESCPFGRFRLLQRLDRFRNRRCNRLGLRSWLRRPRRFRRRSHRFRLFFLRLRLLPYLLVGLQSCLLLRLLVHFQCLRFLFSQLLPPTLHRCLHPQTPLLGLDPRHFSPHAPLFAPPGVVCFRLCRPLTDQQPVGIVQRPDEQHDDQQRCPFVPDHRFEPLGDEYAVCPPPAASEDLRIGSPEVSGSDRPDDHQQDGRPDGSPQARRSHPQQLDSQKENGQRKQFAEDAEPPPDDAVGENGADPSAPVHGVLPQVGEQVAPCSDILVHVPVDQVRDGGHGQITGQKQERQTRPNIAVRGLFLLLGRCPLAGRGRSPGRLLRRRPGRGGMGTRSSGGL